MITTIDYSHNFQTYSVDLEVTLEVHLDDSEILEATEKDTGKPFDIKLLDESEVLAKAMEVL